MFSENFPPILPGALTEIPYMLGEKYINDWQIYNFNDNFYWPLNKVFFEGATPVNG